MPNTPCVPPAQGGGISCSAVPELNPPLGFLPPHSGHTPCAWAAAALVSPCMIHTGSHQEGLETHRNHFGNGKLTPRRFVFYLGGFVFRPCQVYLELSLCVILLCSSCNHRNSYFIQFTAISASCSLSSYLRNSPQAPDGYLEEPDIFHISSVPWHAELLPSPQ